MKTNEFITILKEKEIGDKNYYIEYLKNIEGIYTFKYKEIAENNSNKKYQKILTAKKKLGIYFFYKKQDNQIEWLYIGENHTSSEKRDLSERIKQHFRAKDNGGLPFKIARKEGSSGEKVIENFSVENVKLGYFILNNDMEKHDILLLESFLIAILRPKYNF